MLLEHKNTCNDANLNLEVMSASPHSYIVDNNAKYFDTILNLDKAQVQDAGRTFR